MSTRCQLPCPKPLGANRFAGGLLVFCHEHSNALPTDVRDELTAALREVRWQSRGGKLASAEARARYGQALRAARQLLTGSAQVSP